MCLLIPNNYASYSVSVRQFRQRSLAYFRYDFTVITLATYFAFRYDPNALGTYTLWTFFWYFKELIIYLPFKAHTMYKNNSGFCAKFKVCIFVQSLVINWKVSAFKSATILILTVANHHGTQNKLHRQMLKNKRSYSTLSNIFN